MAFVEKLIPRVDEILDDYNELIPMLEKLKTKEDIVNFGKEHKVTMEINGELAEEYEESYPIESFRVEAWNNLEYIYFFMNGDKPIFDVWADFVDDCFISDIEIDDLEKAYEDGIKWIVERYGLTWDAIYGLADGCAFGDYWLRVKDDARYQVCCWIEENFGFNPENEEVDCVEDEIDNYCLKYSIKFDERGNIILCSEVTVSDKARELLLFYEAYPDRDDKEFDTLDIALDILKEVALLDLD